MKKPYKLPFKICDDNIVFFNKTIDRNKFTFPAGLRKSMKIYPLTVDLFLYKLMFPFLHN